MNKEEQQENLYRILLQRNQFNGEVIRKFRKKSNQYLKRVTNHAHITTLSLPAEPTPNVDHIHQQTQPIHTQEEQKVQAPTSAMCTNGESRQEKEPKDTVRLPAIHPSTAGDYGGEAGEAGVQVSSVRRNLGIRTQVSMSMCGLTIENNGKTNTEISQSPICPALGRQPIKEQTSLIGIPSPKVPKPYSRHQEPLPPGLAHPISNTSLAQYAQSHRREANLSTSHKALLNLQEIVFEASSHKRSSKYGRDGDEGRDSKKMRKYRERAKVREKLDEKQNVAQICYNYNNVQEGRKLTSLQGLKSLTNVITGEGARMSANGQISSISLSALNCINSTVGQQRVKIPQEPDLSAVQTEKVGKLAQALPHIRKLKQLRFNFQKVGRKEPPSSHGHNYSCSVSGLNGLIGNVGTALGSMEGLVDYQMASKVFKMESVPVHQIKWM